MSAGLKADGVDAGVHCRLPGNSGDLVGQAFALRNVDRLKTHFLSVRQALFVAVAHNHHRRAQNLRGGGSRHSDRASTGNVYGRTDTDSG